MPAHPESLLRRAARLRGRDLRDFARAQGAVLAAHWQMRREPAGRLLALQQGARPATGGQLAPVPPRVEQLRVAVARAARFGLTRPTCLTRALALMRLLEREGFAQGVVRIGVRREQGVFAAHAWVDYDGTPLDLDPRLSRPFVTLTDARPNGASGTP
jgi:hypothetical protein